MTTRLSSAVRTASGIAGACALVGTVLAIAAGAPVLGLWLAVTGTVLLIVALAEAGRYTRSNSAGDTAVGFEPTDEIFDDPTTGRRMRVWYDARTGRRTYEPESPP